MFKVFTFDKHTVGIQQNLDRTHILRFRVDIRFNGFFLCHTLQKRFLGHRLCRRKYRFIGRFHFAVFKEFIHIFAASQHQPRICHGITAIHPFVVGGFRHRLCRFEQGFVCPANGVHARRFQFNITRILFLRPHGRILIHFVNHEIADGNILIQAFIRTHLGARRLFRRFLCRLFLGGIGGHLLCTGFGIADFLFALGFALPVGFFQPRNFRLFKRAFFRCIGRQMLCFLYIVLRGHMDAVGIQTVCLVD